LPRGSKEVVVKRASWIVITVAAGLTLLGALVSLGVAYSKGQDGVSGVSIEELANGRPEVLTGLRARRATAASFAAGFAVLLLAIVLGPYRRGDVWAWWAVLAGAVTYALLAMARVPFLGTRSGAGTALVFLAVVVVGLALDPRGVRATPPATLPSR
jgi:hypothetical protein